MIAPKWVLSAVFLFAFGMHGISGDGVENIGDIASSKPYVLEEAIVFELADLFGIDFRPDSSLSHRYEQYINDVPVKHSRCLSRSDGFDCQYLTLTAAESIPKLTALELKESEEATRMASRDVLPECRDYKQELVVMPYGEPRLVWMVNCHDPEVFLIYHMLEVDALTQEIHRWGLYDDNHGWGKNRSKLTQQLREKYGIE